MSILVSVWFWVILAAVFIFAELVVPGGVLIFLGVAGLLVGITTYSGMIDSWTAALTTWLVLSLVLVVSLRGIAQRYIGGDTIVANVDEDLDAVGDLVDVVDTVGPGEEAGRVKYRDSLWQAVGDGSTIEGGSKARIVARENITLIVERTEDA